MLKLNDSIRWKHESLHAAHFLVSLLTDIQKLYGTFWVILLWDNRLMPERNNKQKREKKKSSFPFRLELMIYDRHLKSILLRHVHACSLQLTEKMYRSLDASARFLRFTVPFPVFAYPMYLVSSIRLLNQGLFNSTIHRRALYLILNLTDGGCGSISYWKLHVRSCIEARGKKGLISTRTATCSHQMKGRMLRSQRYVGPWWS